MDNLFNESTMINASTDLKENSSESYSEPEYCDGYGENDFLLRSIWVYCGYPILALGTIGHVLSLILLLTNKGIRALSLSVFLLTMSLAGLMALYAGLLSTIVLHQSCYNIAFKDHTTETGCRLHAAAIYFALQLYSWMEACVSIERLCAVTYPHEYKVLFTRRNNIIITGTIIVALLGLNVIPYKAHGFQNGFCEVTDKHLFNIWRYAHSVIYVALPVAIMLPSNGSTLYMMCHSNFKNSANVKKAKPITIMMFVLNGIFVVTTIPIMVGDWEYLGDSEYHAVLVGWTVSRLMMYLGSSLTFAVYIVVSVRFRKALRDLLNSGVTSVYRAVSTLTGGPYRAPEQSNLNSDRTESSTDRTIEEKL